MAKRRDKQHAQGSLKKLAEAIMLQAMEDIWVPGRKKESMTFFSGEDFNCCAQIIGMSLSDRHKVLEFVRVAHKFTLLIPGCDSGRFKMVYAFFPQHLDLCS